MRYVLLDRITAPELNGSSAQIRSLVFDGSGSYVDELVINCQSNLGVPTCYLRAVSVTSSERDDLTDAVLVGYLRDEKMTDNWRLEAALYTPGSGRIDLKSTLP